MAHYNLGIALRPGEARRGHRRIPRGDPAQARRRRGPHQPRHRPACPGEAGRGGRRIPRGDPAQARLRHGPVQPRQRPESQGKLDEAIADYREAIRLKPDYAMAHNNLAYALTMHPDPAKRDPAAALEHARKATQLEPRNWASSSIRLPSPSIAPVCATRPWPRSASRWSCKAVVRADWFFLAMIEHERGNAAEAARWFDKSLPWIKQGSPRTPSAPGLDRSGEAAGPPRSACPRPETRARPTEKP